MVNNQNNSLSFNAIDCSYEYFDKNLTSFFLFYFTGCQRRKNLGCGHAEIEANNNNTNKKVVKKGRKKTKN